MTPSDGLHFSFDTEVEQLRSSETVGPHFNSGRPKTLDWTTDQHLDTGWISARVPAYFAVRKSETRRERLAIHRAEDGTIHVVNGLGVAIDALHYMDENGVISVAADVPAGQERTLNAQKPQRRPVGEPQQLNVIYNKSWNMSLHFLGNRPNNS